MKTLTPHVQQFAGRFAALSLAVVSVGIHIANSRAALPVPECSRTFTLNADFDEGTLVNVSHDIPDQLQLNATITPFPFVNIACSSRGTMVRIDVNTGAILGEYLTAPDGMGRDPSRTTVDKLGNVWVSNRAEDSGGKGSLTRVALVIGGTRCNADGTANPVGDYLKPPFLYNTCVDRDGDGLIKTSRGLGDIRPWLNTGGADSSGGVSTAEDEAIINYTRVGGTNLRTVAVDINNDVWTGGLTNTVHEKISGVTGAPIPGTQFNVGAGGYGGLIDGNGVLWSARGGTGLLWYDTNTPIPGLPGSSYQLFYATRGSYGLGIDPNTGHVWHSSYGVWPLNLYELDANGNVVNSYAQPFHAQGVCVDANSHVWMAEVFGSYIWHLAPDPSNPGTHYSVGFVDGLQGVTGVAVDSNGKIWAAEINGNRASRIDPAAGAVDSNGNHLGAIDLSVSLGAGAGPYNYSDMTGFVSIGNPPQGTWTVVHDSGAVGTNWGKVCWTSTEPVGTSIKVEVRAADLEAGLPAMAFVPVDNCVSLCSTPIAGRFIEIRTTLAIAQGVVATPVLYDLSVQCCESSILPGRMTGGGSVQSSIYGKVTHAFELHRDVRELPNNLQVSWGKGNSFHLEQLTWVETSDDPAITDKHPAAGFNTYLGEGIGRYNGQPGYIATWRFTDAGEPGSKDYAEITIVSPGGALVLHVAGTLQNGNHQAHK